MNAFLRSLLVLVTLLLLLPTHEAAAGPLRALLGTDAPGKYSVVKEYKEAYARPKRKLFGKRKTVNRQLMRARRVSRW